MFLQKAQWKVRRKRSCFLNLKPVVTALPGMSISF